MNRISIRLPLLGVLVLLSFASNHAVADEGEGNNRVPECVHVRKEARYGVTGYDHLVFVKNECRQAATCTVATDVTPEPQEVRVAPGEEETVLTRRGSPAREFAARVSCELEG